MECFKLLYRSYKFIWNNKYATSIDNLAVSINDFKLFPNPVNDKLKIIFDNKFPEVTFCKILDINRILHFQKTINQKSQKTDIIIDTGNLKEGIYFLTIGNSEFQKSKKFVKTNMN